MENEKQILLKQLPQIDKIIKSDIFAEKSKAIVKSCSQAVLDQLRNEILTKARTDVPSLASIQELVSQEIQKKSRRSLQKVVNATGTIVHTNLGRSVLSETIRDGLEDVAFSYSNLEFDLEKGKRGSRYQHLEKLIQKLTGAEDVLVVNNNAAAVMLALDTLIKGKEVLISRGELVEIGGSFRIPEIIELSGGHIHEVGTTNKTHLQDYKDALNENLGAIMRVHTSNYRIIGFTESPSIDELAALAHAHGLPLINDLGSGLLVDLKHFGLPYEPTVKEAVIQGCDVVMFSGDKLLGGPQAGIIVGKRKYIEPMKSSQLLRALRVDKLTLAALEATLSIYLDEETAVEKIPTLQMISKPVETCLEDAQQLKEMLDACTLPLEISIHEEESNIGGGSYPEYTLPTYCISITPVDMSVSELEKQLRVGRPAVVARIKKDQLLFDLRTLSKNDFPAIIHALKQIF